MTCVGNGHISSVIMCVIFRCLSVSMSVAAVKLPGIEQIVIISTIRTS